MAKDFGGVYGLTEVSYERCVACGFVQSSTHAKMPLAEWERLNREFHASYQGSGVAEGDPRWMERIETQARVMTRLVRDGILPGGPWVDYACGDGELADRLERNGLDVTRYDRYMRTGVGRYLEKEELLKSGKKWEVVINTSAFEHFLSMEPIEEIFELARDGVLAVHTLVSERVPTDALWFYLFPVHVSFFTNAAMQILFERYGFASSIYHVEARLWFWFRHRDRAFERYCASHSAAGDTLVWRDAFVDYWKE
ncbi:MAG: methyltransferase domain-containing protein [Magnetococcales bacterium]|nr:methyltransferase domain-containing protein [Magnetococcales bacterium]